MRFRLNCGFRSESIREWFRIPCEIRIFQEETMGFRSIVPVAL